MSQEQYWGHIPAPVLQSSFPSNTASSFIAGLGDRASSGNSTGKSLLWEVTKAKGETTNVQTTGEETTVPLLIVAAEIFLENLVGN